MNLCRSPRVLMWLCSGLFLGVGYQIVVAADKPTPPAPNPNVVVLKSTKRISLETPKMRWDDLAKELARQTGYAFTLDPQLAKDETACAYLLKDVPLANVLGLSSYLSGGTWERRGSGYHLRPKTLEEIDLDADRYHALLMQGKDYIDQVPRDRLNNQQQMARDALDRYLPNYYDLSGPPQPWMGDWKVTIGERGISLNQFQEIRTESLTIGGTKVIGGSW